MNRCKLTDELMKFLHKLVIHGVQLTFGLILNSNENCISKDKIILFLDILISEKVEQNKK